MIKKNSNWNFQSENLNKYFKHSRGRMALVGRIQGKADYGSTKVEQVS